MTTLRNVYLPLSGTAPDGTAVDVEFDEAITAIRPAATLNSQDGDGGAVIDGDGGEVIDGAGLYLVPGLIDTHVHLGTREGLVNAARAGLTTVVDLGTHPDELIDGFRAETGIPSILSAGSPASAPGSTQISAMGFPAESGVSDPEDAARYLDRRVEHGADLLKIIIEDPAVTDVPALDVPTLAALVSGAHDRGLLCVAHVVTPGAFDRGLAADVDILTHVPLEGMLSEATIVRMLAQGTVASPTLTMMRAMARALFPDRAVAALGNALECVRALHEAGVPIIVGTDANETAFAPVSHGASLHDEIELLQQAGLSPLEALHGATAGAAAALQRTDRGRVATGLRADLVLVDADPYEDPGVLRAPHAVWVAGERVAESAPGRRALAPA